MRHRNVLPRFANQPIHSNNPDRKPLLGLIFVGGLLVCLLGSTLVVVGTMGTALPLVVIGGFVIGSAVLGGIAAICWRQRNMNFPY